MKTGQRVVCIQQGEWERAVSGQPDNKPYDPQKGLIYTINETFLSEKFGLCLGFKETRNDLYVAKYFAPLDENWTEEVIKEALKEEKNIFQVIMDTSIQ